MRKKILFIGGSLNQTKMAHAVASHLLDEYDCAFTPLYADAGLLQWLAQRNLLDFTVLGEEPFQGVGRGAETKVANVDPHHFTFPSGSAHRQD